MAVNLFALQNAASWPKSTDSAIGSAGQLGSEDRETEWKKDAIEEDKMAASEWSDYRIEQYSDRIPLFCIEGER